MMKAGYSTPMLRVRDVDRSILFYEQLGFSLVDSEGSPKNTPTNALRHCPVEHTSGLRVVPFIEQQGIVFTQFQRRDATRKRPGGASGSNRACCAATRAYSTISSTVLVEMCLCSLPWISADQSFSSV
jgi:hypothetical protein